MSKPHVYFTLKNYTDKNGERQVMARVYLGNKKEFVHTVDVKVVPKHWDANKQRVKSMVLEYRAYNDIIQDAAKMIDHVCATIIEERKPITKELLAERIAIVQGKRGSSVYDYFEKYMEQGSYTKTRATVVRERTLLFVLKKFEEETGYSITFESLNNNFYQKFCMWHYQHGLLDNTIASRVKKIKTFLKWCYKTHDVKIHDLEDFKVRWDSKKEIYLTPSELRQIITADLTGQDRLINVRKIFLFQCYCGVRVSELQSVSIENLNKGILPIIDQKNKKQRVIIITHEAERILRSGFRLLSDQKYNQYIKELCKVAGITSSFNVLRTSGGRSRNEVKEKWEFITSHVGRATFVTNSLNAKASHSSVMQNTGHTNTKTLDIYTKSNPHEAHKQLLEAEQTMNLPPLDL